MVTRAQLKELYPRATDTLLDAMANQIGGLFQQFGITTPLRIQFFLAQIGHESGGGTVREENMNYRAARIREVWPTRFASEAAAKPFAHQPEKLANKVYADRMGNGPPESGDGFRFRGRGLIQITGRDGYKNVGREAGLELVGSPQLAFEPKHALLIACAFWKWKGVNTVCDTGNFVNVTKRINGGTVGLADRRAWLDKVRRVLAPSAGAASKMNAEKIREVQLALRAQGFDGVGAADGLVGPKTMAAVAEFRRQKGMPEGGIDDALIAALLGS